MPISCDAAVSPAVIKLLHPVGAVAFYHGNGGIGDGCHNPGMPYRASAIEEDLIPGPGIHVAAALLLIVLHGVDAGGAQVACLALDPLTVRPEGLEEAPINKALAPGVAVLAAVVVAGGGEVPGVLGPVAAAGVGLRII